MPKENIKIELNPQKNPENITEILDTIFWKEKHITPKAKQLLDYIKTWSATESPHKASDWKTYCEKTGLTQSQYHTILRRLKKTGLIEKKYDKQKRKHVITTSNKFTETLKKISEITAEYMEDKDF